jgi:hypothetical protein
VPPTSPCASPEDHGHRARTASPWSRWPSCC